MKLAWSVGVTGTHLVEKGWPAVIFSSAFVAANDARLFHGLYAQSLPQQIVYIWAVQVTARTV